MISVFQTTRWKNISNHEKTCLDGLCTVSLDLYGMNSITYGDNFITKGISYLEHTLKELMFKQNKKFQPSFVLQRNFDI